MKSADEPVRRRGGAALVRSGRILSVLAAFLATCAPWACGSASKDDAPAVLDQFRRSIWAEATYAEFDLREMPRHGAERLLHGRFWGSRNGGGPVTRFELADAKGAFTHRFLIQGGEDPGLWTSDGPGPGTPNPAALLSPVASGVEMTPFDLIPMPYLYWLDAGLVSISRVRGRQAFIFLATPPGEFSAKWPGIKAVRMYLDAQYDALEQSEVVGQGGGVARTLSLLELRKVGPRWIPKDLDIRDESTRNKTRLSLTAIAVGITFGTSTFDPSVLGTPQDPPAGDQLTRINP